MFIQMCLITTMCRPMPRSLLTCIAPQPQPEDVRVPDNNNSMEAEEVESTSSPQPASPLSTSPLAASTEESNRNTCLQDSDQINIDAIFGTPKKELKKVKSGFTDSISHIIIYFYIKQIRKDNLKIYFSSNQIDLGISTSNGPFLADYSGASRDTVFEHPIYLYDQVVPAECSFGVDCSKLQLKLKKVVAEPWDHYSKTYAEKKAVIPLASPPPATSPSSSPGQSTSLYSSKDFYRSRHISEGCEPGFMGLDNFGNTCYMNSVSVCWC